MRVGIRSVSDSTVAWFREAVSDPEQTRASLYRELCEREGWRDHRGRLRVSAASRFLIKLAASLGLDLPPSRRSPCQRRRRKARQLPAPVADLPLCCSLADLGAVRLEPVADGADQRRWQATMDAWHPQGWKQPPGRRLHYWIRSERHGVLGGICFTAATWQLAARDQFIGWTRDALAANIGRVINNHRFLILPSVKVFRLASTVLKLATAQIGSDWEAAYGVRPLLAYSYSGPEHSGWSYRAAHWRRTGQTCGRRGVVRTVWVKPLAAGWREELCRPLSPPALGSVDPPYVGPDADFAEREYGSSSHSDGRIRRRIVSMGRAWADRLGNSLGVMFSTSAAWQGAMRLLSNPRVNMEHVTGTHYERSVQRCDKEPVVLAIQDTTAIDYSGLEATEGLANIGGGGKGSSGLLAHVGLAATPGGRMLGLFTLDADFRDRGGKDSVRWLEGLKRAGEVDAACPDTKVVSVCDREGDFWELLNCAVQGGHRLLVRASASVRRKALLPDGAEKDLLEYAASLDKIGTRTIHLPACGGPRRRRKSNAVFEIRATEVKLVPPGRFKDRTPLTLYLVAATATHAKVKGKPLHWVLLTTEKPSDGQTSVDHAMTMIRWYQRRWTIELFFKTLKQGTRIKRRQFSHADDLRKCLAFDMITAYGIYELTYYARERPNSSAAKLVGQQTIDKLYRLLKHQGHTGIRGPPARIDIRTYVIDLARLVGFRPTKRQPMPGTKRVWQANEILMLVIIGTEI